MSSLDLFLLVAGTIFPSGFAASLFLYRPRKYTNWAKGTGIIVAIGGFVWGGIHWVLLHSRSLHVTRDAYYHLVEYRGLVEGLILGFALSILIARPYEKRCYDAGDLTNR